MALLVAWPQACEAATPLPTQPSLVPLSVSMDVDNVYGFSSRDKTYTVEGTLQVTAPETEMGQWLAAGIDPISLLRFQNMVQPWNSAVEPTSGAIRAGNNLGKNYRFNGSFYSDEIDYRSYPFGALPLTLHLAPDPSFPTAIADPPAIRLEAIQEGSGVSKRTNMNGYKLASWRFYNETEGVRMELTYQPIGWAALVKWLMPLAITMTVMLLTPNLRSSFSSERLAIPPVVLLTLVFMQQAYRDSLPSLPYLTVLDGLYAFSYLVTLIFFCEFIWCANVMDRYATGNTAPIQRRAERLEVLLQLASLGGYAVLLVWAWAQR